MTHRTRRGALGLAVATAALIAGCSDGPQRGDTLLAPVPDAAFRSESSSAPDMSRLARFGTGRQITIAWARKWIGPEGGRLEFLGFAVDVPPGAVDKLTQFSIRLPVDPHGSNKVVARFGPHGAQFSEPVTIEFPYAGTSIEGSESATVVWWNDGWVDMGGSVTEGGVLRTTTDHFSTFGTTDDDFGRGGGGISASGG